MIIVEIIYDTRFGGGFSSVFIGFGVYGVTLVSEGYSAGPFLFAILIATVFKYSIKFCIDSCDAHILFSRHLFCVYLTLSRGAYIRKDFIGFFEIIYPAYISVHINAVFAFF